MISINVNIKDGEHCSYDISGHAHYAEFGNDIVCAAVSVLSQAITNGIILVLGEDEAEKYYSIEETGDLKLDYPVVSDDILKAKIDILFDTLYVNLKILSEDYEGFISFTEKEVEK